MKKAKCEYRPVLSVGEKRISVSAPENCKAEFIGANFIDRCNQFCVAVVGAAASSVLRS